MKVHLADRRFLLDPRVGPCRRKTVCGKTLETDRHFIVHDKDIETIKHYDRGSVCVVCFPDYVGATAGRPGYFKRITGAGFIETAGFVDAVLSKGPGHEADN